jgi:NADH-quinone oxidoreductase subunit E
MTECVDERINELISHYPEDKRKSALLPVLHEVQDAHDNWLSIELQNKVAEILKIKPLKSMKWLLFTPCSTNDQLENTCLNFVKLLLVV